jgi:23S rRNA pseudouridine2605 synthase
MGIGEGGLELFVNDGTLAAALMGSADKFSSEYSVRVRGDFDESRVDEVLATANADAEARGRIDSIEFTGGEAANRWAQVTCTGLRPRDLKRMLEASGIEANRIMRTRFGPISMDRSLARGVSRRLTAGEMASLADVAGIRLPRKPSRKTTGRHPRKPTGSRKPAR